MRAAPVCAGVTRPDKHTPIRSEKRDGLLPGTPCLPCGNGKESGKRHEHARLHMNPGIIADLHSHTVVSHGRDTPEAMLRAAQEAGLEFFGISEHSVLPSPYVCRLYRQDMPERMPALLDWLDRQRRTAARPRLLMGLELDWTPDRPEYMRQIAASRPFDYIIGSIHHLDDRLSVGSAANWPCSENEADTRFSRYYALMADMAASGIIHIASHPDFIKLHCHSQFRRWITQPRNRDKARPALLAMKRHDVLMEVSSAGLRQPFAEAYPGLEIMALAADIGVAISFGSDAHTAADVAGNFAALESYARSFGYTQSAMFIQGEKKILPLPATGERWRA